MVSTRQSKHVIVVSASRPPPSKPSRKRKEAEQEHDEKDKEEIKSDEIDEAVKPPKRKRLRKMIVDEAEEQQEEEDEWIPGELAESENDADGEDLHENSESELDEEEQAELTEMLMEALTGRKKKAKSTVWQDKIKLSNIPEEHKAEMLKRAEDVDEAMEDGEHRDSKTELLLRRLLRIPFSVYTPPPMGETLKEKALLLKTARTALDKTVYGMNVAKNELLNVMAQMLAWADEQRVVIQPLSLSAPPPVLESVNVQRPKPRIFCLVSAPGLGKTLLATEGLKAILKRPAITFSLAGMTESTQLLGCSFFYEGAHPGSLYDALVSAQCMDPILVFDEIDKVADTPSGRALTNTMIHLTDPLSNHSIKDAYIAPVTLDLSACPMVFLCNDPELIPPVLRDRMHFIHIDPPTHQERIHIVREYLWTQVLTKLKLTNTLRNVHFTHQSIEALLDMSKNQDGLRGVKHLLETVALTLNRQHMMGEIELTKAEVQIDVGTCTRLG